MRMNSSGIRYSNMVPLQESSVSQCGPAPRGLRKSEPVLHRHIVLGDRHQAGEPALAGQQIVVAGELQRTADQVSDREQPPAFVIQEPHVDAFGQALDAGRQGIERLEHFRGVCSGLSVFAYRLDPATPRLPAASRELPAA